MSRQLLRRQNTRTGGGGIWPVRARECRVAQQPCWAADSENGSGKDMSRGRVTWLGFFDIGARCDVGRCRVGLCSRVGESRYRRCVVLRWQIDDHCNKTFMVFLLEWLRYISSM
jgi:hypothetical protein